MAAGIVHCLPVKFCTVIGRMLAARRHRTVITLTKVEAMVDVSVKMFRPVEPGSRPYEYAADEPLRPVISIRSTVVRRDFIVSVRTNRRRADVHADRNLRGSARGNSQENTRNSTEKEELRFHIHLFLQSGISLSKSRVGQVGNLRRIANPLQYWNAGSTCGITSGPGSSGSGSGREG
jgi:hypothetical protein